MKRILAVACFLCAVSLLLFFLPVADTTQGQTIDIVYVSQDDPTCGGNTPCYVSIQAAIDAVGMNSAPLDSSDTSSFNVRITKGSYGEDLALNDPLNIDLEGGWDSDFAGQTSNTYIGSLTIGGDKGTLSVANIVIGSPSGPPTPQNLSICETGSRTEFNNLDVCLWWSPSTDPMVIDYNLEVLTTATMVRRRLIENIRGCKATYPYGQNKTDGGGTPEDGLTFRLWAVDTEEEQSSDYDQISVTNPRPADVTGLVSDSWMYAVRFRWSKNPESDVEAYRYQTRILSDPTTEWTEPTETTNLNIFVFLNEDQEILYVGGATIEIRLWAVDTWGNVSANAVVGMGITDFLG
ncbi:MAG: hypothetical protein H8E19_17400 [Deltaproteobacteria bacterium]|uniref:DUF1565 domain-containing protein n=1 Tax=Candidatus Desulfacyla euxinica TaxID=2841693 RepID=A0A8J6T503_9DELT|nr:hypothetical protein [Candidatus Desulfacyla euxinica]MBL7218395.1 hypothetical protein [Desulfobacteraceae bacterium]